MAKSLWFVCVSFYVWHDYQIGWILLSTNLFLLISYYYLGVRSYKVLLFSSFPVVAGLQFMLHELLDVYIRDPFLQFLGVIS